MKKKAKKQTEACEWCGNPDPTWPWYSVTMEYFIVGHPEYGNPTVIWRKHEVPYEETRDRIKVEILNKMPGRKCVEPDYTMTHWHFWLEKEESAGVAQSAERQSSKLDVAGSSPASRLRRKRNQINEVDVVDAASARLYATIAGVGG